MNIKIEPGANVQITDKPIYNIFGDVVQQKNILSTSPDNLKTESERQQEAQDPCHPESFVRTYEREQGDFKKPDYSLRSFILRPKSNRSTDSSRQLKLLYQFLHEKDNEGVRFIDDMAKHNDIRKTCYDENTISKMTSGEIEQALFNLVFSGSETDVVIVWKGNANELEYLIYSLHKLGVLDWVHPGPKIWELTRLRFMNGKAKKVLDERTGKNVSEYDVVPFEEKAFGKHNFPKDTSKLDGIINKIAPPETKDTIRDEVANYFSGYSNQTKKDKKGNTVVESGFRETSHKGRNRD